MLDYSHIEYTLKADRSPMEKTIFSRQYAVLLGLLRAKRQASGLTQEDLAGRLGQTQSFISKCERGERRLDVAELRALCMAMDIDFARFISDLEEELHVAGI
jgi:transcriptional regulator with XRE-family HTH domain